ncbi:hypothetical protein KCU65_g5676, partial [Aureobasidium melanogenum]
MSQSNSTSEASGMPEALTVTGDCTICIEENVQLLKLPCSHLGFCSSCHATELTSLQEDSRRPACTVCDQEFPLQILQPLIPADLYERMSDKIYVEWATPSNERLYCANTGCTRFIPVSAPLSSKGERQCLSCDMFTCACKKLAHDGTCVEDESLQEAMRVATENGVQEEMDDEDEDEELDAEDLAQLAREAAEADALFEFAGRPLARQVLAGSHVSLIMLREYLARIDDHAFNDMYETINFTLREVHDINAPMDPIGLWEFTRVVRQLSNHEFEVVHMPSSDAYNMNQHLIDRLFNRFREYRSQEFIDYEIEATRRLFAIYGDTDSDANELREQIRETFTSFNTTERNPLL